MDGTTLPFPITETCPPNSAVSGVCFFGYGRGIFAAHQWLAGSICYWLAGALGCSHTFILVRSTRHGSPWFSGASGASYAMDDRSST
jgi:hypothetical protein